MGAGPVRVICPNLKCRAALSCPSSARGKVIRCRQCGMRITVPATRPAAEEASSNSSKEASSKQASSKQASSNESSVQT